MSLCADIDIASQGDSVQEARAKLAEAVHLIFGVAEPADEVRHRTSTEMYVARIEVAVPRASAEHAVRVDVPD